MGRGMLMHDRFGRKIEYLRISVTQSCNLKCIYCMPSGGEDQCPICESLTPEEYETVVRSMASAGIRKVRLTGGEPLIRHDICDIVRHISKIPEIEDISMTTNGVSLFDMAEELKSAGLNRLNISLDSLNSSRFSYITGGGKLDKTLKGIHKALKIGLTPIHINTVLIKGINADELEAFMELTRDCELDVRFIELMPIGRFGEENAHKAVNNSDIIEAYPSLKPCGSDSPCEPARYYRFEGYKGRIGFISPMSHKFCSSCNRIRLTCDGKIKPCLGDNGEVSIVDVLRNAPEKLDKLVKDIIFNKPRSHNFAESFVSKRSMNKIGG